MHLAYVALPKRKTMRGAKRIWHRFNDTTSVLYISGRAVIFDTEDFKKLVPYKWNVGQDGYVHANVNGKQTLMHRFLMNAPKGKIIDHANRNPIDNRKVNLRFCTYAQNNWNKPPINFLGYRRGVRMGNISYTAFITVN